MGTGIVLFGSLVLTGLRMELGSAVLESGLLFLVEMYG